MGEGPMAPPGPSVAPPLGLTEMGALFYSLVICWHRKRAK